MATQVIRITFAGEPITKANQTFFAWSRKKRKGVVHIPGKFLDYEEALGKAAAEQMKKAKKTIFEYGPVEIEINYYLKTKRKKDVTNLPKTTCDALNGVAYTDDSQIVRATLNKYYDKENPRVEIVVRRPKSWKVGWLGSLWPLTVPRELKKKLSGK